MSPKTAPLARYREMRDFSRTSEPSGDTKVKAGQRFVVQKHAATRLHYDFRLELEGVLVSWAVTRGPSANPDDKRLAVRTEDHPIDYATFEGTIPQKEYGGGTVMLWDTGRWEPVPGKDPKQTLAEGHLHFVLHGQRMKGEWILVRLKPRPGEKRENWLLRKVEDEHAGGSDDLVGRHLTSVESGRTLDQIAAGTPVKKPRARKPGSQLPPFQPVQLAALVDHVPTGRDWLHEVKFDGYRTLIAIGGGAARAYTRSGLDWSDKFASLVEAARALPCDSALIDGEAVVLMDDGRTSFQSLQAALKGAPDRIDYFAFDLLMIDGDDLTGQPLRARKARLETLLGKGSGRIRYSDHIAGSGEALFDKFCEKGLEGVISKRADARYVGARNGAWVKTKCTRHEALAIVGWLPSDKTRGFRSLLLGRDDGGVLRYAGKVGTGFGEAEMARLQKLLAPLESATPTVEAPRAAVRGARWVKPELAANVAYGEITGDGVLRHPSYLGLETATPPDRVTPKQAKTKAPPKAPPPAKPSGVKISNRDRILFPEAGISKGQLADHYDAVAGIMLPWVARRPISLVRCPQGRAKQCFFQKHDAGSFGDTVRRVAITEKDGDEADYLYVEDAAGLLTCIQMGTIELHGWGSTVDTLEQPDRLVIDLDPDEGLDFRAVADAAARIRDLLSDMGLTSFPMATGGKGIHVVVPLVPAAQWPAVKDFARRLATALAQTDSERFTATMAKAQRKGRIFIDWLRNQRGATAVMPYSVRARENGPVAAPLTWEELRTLDTPAHWRVGDADELVARAASRELAGWGRADQALPDL